MGKPKVLVTSRLPSAALDLLFEKCDVDYRDESSPMPHAELLERVKPAEGLVCQLTNTIGRDVMDAGQKLRVDRERRRRLQQRRRAVRDSSAASW